MGDTPEFDVGAAMGAAMDGMAVLDGEEYVYANEAYAEIYGFDDPADLVGEPWHARYPAEERDRFERHIMPTVRAEGEWRGEVVGRRRDGTPFPEELSLSLGDDGTVVCVVRDISERKELERDLQRERDRLRVLVENLPTPVVYGPTSADGPLVEEVNPAFEAVFGCDAEAVEGTPLDDLIVPAGVDNSDLNRRIVEEGSVEAEVRRQAADGIREFHLQTAVVPVDDAGGSDGDGPEDAGGSDGDGPDDAGGSDGGGPFEGWAIYTDITEQKERERRLQRRRDELETLDRINELLLETTRELVETASREAVERTVCERLADSDLYQFAWIGERAIDGDGIAVRTSAGSDGDYLEAVTITTDGGTATGRSPEGRALRTGEVQVATATDPDFEPWRDAIPERGIESVAAVPLGHGGTVYGVLAVYATREDAFSEREQAGFDVLGRTVGFVINALKSHRLLFADAVTELEFLVTDRESLLVRASDALDCVLSLDGYVVSDGRWVLYVRLDGASAGAAVRAAAGEPGVERTRIVGDGEGDPLLELVLTEMSLLHTVSRAGATVREAVADRGTGRIVVEAPASVDVREVVEFVRSEYPQSELNARRERDRRVDLVGVPEAVLDGLTARQRQALEAAYRGGYFTWPRESTAEEIATALDISAPTLHGHLRKAEHALLAELFDHGATERG